jgi:hypothetical protein
LSCGSAPECATSAIRSIIAWGISQRWFHSLIWLIYKQVNVEKGIAFGLKRAIVDSTDYKRIMSRLTVCVTGAGERTAKPSNQKKAKAMKSA